MVKINIDEIDNLFDKNKFIKENFINDSIEISFSYKSYFFNSKILRDFLDTILSYFNIPAEWKIRMVLIVDEMNNNAIEYWSIEWETNFLRLKFSKKLDSFYINLEVEDTWHWLSSKNSHMMYDLEKQSLNRVENKSIRWRGLFVIIKKLVDKLYFKDANWWWLIVWIEKEISRS